MVAKIRGRDVVDASRTAFDDAPDAFPAHLAIPVKSKAKADDAAQEPNRAFAALVDAAEATGNWFAYTANAVGGGVATGAVVVGTGVASATDTVTRPFRRVDLDGDGIVDEPQALSRAKDIRGSIAGAADAVGDGFAGLFKPKKPTDNARG